MSQYVVLLGFAEPKSEECSWELCSTIPRSSVIRESENTAAEAHEVMHSISYLSEFYFYIIHSFYQKPSFGPTSLSLLGLCSIPLGFSI